MEKRLDAANAGAWHFKTPSTKPCSNPSFLVALGVSLYYAVSVIQSKLTGLAQVGYACIGALAEQVSQTALVVSLGELQVNPHGLGIFLDGPRVVASRHITLAPSIISIGTLGV